MIRVERVYENSLGAELGIEPGYELLEVNGRPLDDFLDWEYLTAEEQFVLLVSTNDGSRIEYLDPPVDEWNITFVDTGQETPTIAPLIAVVGRGRGGRGWTSSGRSPGPKSRSLFWTCRVFLSHFWTKTSAERCDVVTTSPVVSSLWCSRHSPPMQTMPCGVETETP